MAKLRYRVETSLPPERVLAIATDFSERRPTWWPSIDPDVYRVHDIADGRADVTEGSDIMGGIWTRELYEWSGNTVTARVQDSNVFRRGVWQLTATPKPGGGTIVDILNHRRARGVRGHAIGAMLQLSNGKPLVKALRRTLEIAAGAART